MAQQFFVKIFQKNNLGQLQTSTSEFLNSINQNVNNRIYDIDYFTDGEKFYSSITYIAEEEIE